MPRKPATPPKPQPHKVTFRLPDALYTALTQSAQRDTRAINGQVIVLLREALVAREHQDT